MKFKFNEEKAISAILYISKKLLSATDKRIKADFHKIFKILYFADQKHLHRYGRPIVGDCYIAMKSGPVPSRIYDILKDAKDKKDYTNFIDVRGYYVHPKQEPDMDMFSESDIECIDKSIEENKYLTFDELLEKSHDSAYKKATKDDKISLSEIAKAGGTSKEMLSYIKTLAENETILGA